MEAAKFLNRVLEGDALATLSMLPNDVVDTIITSPAYYRQRDYQISGQHGLERSPQDYVDRMVSVFREARRVVKPTGSVWLVLGDKYQGGQMLGMPWRVALALQLDGWYLRSDVIWQKPNAMPSPNRNRPTTDHEYVFFLTKNANYFYDADAIREPHRTFSEDSRMKGGRKHFGIRGGTPESGKNGGNSNLHDGRWDQAFHPLGRNKRTVWSIPLSKYRGAHFAVFPERLVETCIHASCPKEGTVLDPFCGSGTTIAVAQRLGRQFIGIDLNPEYCQMARRRLQDPRGPATTFDTPR